MARIEQIRLVDDLDGSNADETVEFVADNVAYEIDLSQDHAAALRDALSPYVAAARRAPSGAARPRRARSTSTSTTAERRQHNNAIRSWARQKGYPIGDRGRLPVEIVEAYENNAGSGPVPSPRAASPRAASTTSASATSASTTSVPQFQEAG